MISSQQTHTKNGCRSRSSTLQQERGAAQMAPRRPRGPVSHWSGTASIAVGFSQAVAGSPGWAACSAASGYLLLEAQGFLAGDQRGAAGGWRLGPHQPEHRKASVPGWVAAVPRDRLAVLQHAVWLHNLRQSTYASHGMARVLFGWRRRPQWQRVP